MGKQQRTLEEMFGGTSNANQNENTPTENRTLEEMFGGTESTVDTQPVSEENQQAQDLEKREAEIKKIDAMSNEELVKYIDSLPGGKTKSDKPLPDKATGPGPTQKFQESSLFLSNMPELKESVKQEIKDQAALAMGDNSSIVFKFQNIFGNDDKVKATSEYLQKFLNPAAFKSMAEYAGNEELKTDFNNAYTLTSQFVDELTEANKLKNELQPYLEKIKQPETNEQVADLNLKFKRLNELQNNLITYITQKKNDKGEMVASDMLQAIENVRNQNTWQYGNIDDDRFGFDDNGNIVTGKEFKRTTEQIIVTGDYKTDAANMDPEAGFKSISNIDTEFNNLYKQRVTPIYKSFLDNAVKKLDSKNPDIQRQAFDLLLGTLRGSNHIPYPERVVQRIQQAGSYDDQLQALKSMYQMPISGAGSLKELLMDKTSQFEQSQFVLTHSRSAFGQDASNYPINFDDEIKSQSDWMSFASNGTLAQLQKDKQDWATSSEKIQETMRRRIDIDDDVKNVVNNYVESSKASSLGPMMIDGLLPGGIDRNLLVEATQELIQPGRILGFTEWLNKLRSGPRKDINISGTRGPMGLGEYNFKTDADVFSYLFGYAAFSDDVDAGGFHNIYLDDNGVPSPYQDNPKLSAENGYTAWSFSPMKTNRNNINNDYSSDFRNPKGMAYNQDITTRTAAKSIMRAKKYYDAIVPRLKEAYNDLQVSQANNSTLKLSGLGNYGTRGLKNIGLDLRMTQDGQGASLQNRTAYKRNNKGISLETDQITEVGYENPQLKVDNKHKNIQDGIFKIIAPDGEFIDYNDPSFTDQFTDLSGPYSAHVNTNNIKNLVTVTNEWDNNAMGNKTIFVTRNATKNKENLENFFHKKENESDKDYEKRMGQVEMTFRRVGMLKDNATYKFTDGDGKSIFVNIPYSQLEASNENFYKYTGKTVGEKEFEITGQELLPMPKLANGDNAFDNKELFLEVNGEGMYVIPITFTDENGIEQSYDLPTNLYQQMVMLPQARNLANELLNKVAKEVIQPIND